MSEPAAILVDWGTTNFRAWLVGEKHVVLDQRQATCGIMEVSAGGYLDALETQIGGWRRLWPKLQVLMSGMVGSKQGWVETPYVPCPASIAELSMSVVPVEPGEAIHIVPGIAYKTPDGRHDVMRGEEVQIFGALDSSQKERQVFCLPGTHSKWAVVEVGRIVWFGTAMTGEVWSVMSEHSILGRLMEGGSVDDLDAFRQGFLLSKREGGLLNHLFAVRAEAIFGTIPPSGLRSYLSGILIGHEVRAMSPLAGPAEPVKLIGRPDLTNLYAEAISMLGHAPVPVPAETATLKGLTLLQETMTHA